MCILSAPALLPPVSKTRPPSARLSQELLEHVCGENRLRRMQGDALGAVLVFLPGAPVILNPPRIHPIRV